MGSRAINRKSAHDLAAPIVSRYDGVLVVVKDREVGLATTEVVAEALDSGTAIPVWRLERKVTPRQFSDAVDLLASMLTLQRT